MKVLSTRARIRRLRAGAGFNLLELMVVMAIIMILAVLVIPEFRHLLRRFKLDGAVQGMSHVISQARAEAIRRGVPVVVRADIAENVLVVFADVNDNMDFDPAGGAPQGTTDYQVARFPLPGGNLSETAVKFWGAEDDIPGDVNVTSGLTTDPSTDQVAVFLPNGSIRDVGGFRIAMGADREGGISPDTDEFRNFFEVAIEPQATAKITVRKWVPKVRLTAIGLGAVDSAYLEKFKHDGNWTWVWY